MSATILDIRTAQTVLENTMRDTILYALGQRLPSVASVAELRAFATAAARAGDSLRSEDELIPIVSGGSVTGNYRWSTTSTAVDDGTNAVKPDDVTGAGRWLLWTSPLRIAPVVGQPSYYLHELATGPLRRVILLDRDMPDEEVRQLVQGQVPAVIVEATSDDPEDAQLDTGYRWLTDYTFTLWIITENLRDRRQAAQGSDVMADIDPGANTIDGLLQHLLGGTQVSALLEGLNNVRIGRGHNRTSDLAQRRIIRVRTYTIQASVVNQPAPNDATPLTEIDAQSHMVDLNSHDSYNTTDRIIASNDHG